MKFTSIEDARKELDSIVASGKAVKRVFEVNDFNKLEQDKVYEVTFKSVELKVITPEEHERNHNSFIEWVESAKCNWSAKRKKETTSKSYTKPAENYIQVIYSASVKDSDGKLYNVLYRESDFLQNVELNVPLTGAFTGTYKRFTQDVEELVK